MSKRKTTFLDVLAKLAELLLSKKKRTPSKDRTPRNPRPVPVPPRRKPDVESKPKETPRKKEHPKSDAANIVLTEAEKVLGTHYKYAGASPKEGFDCSGLVYYAFSKAGISITRASYMQAEEGTPIKLSDVRPGDLIFFSHSGDKIGHVGIVISEEGEALTMIHSSSSKGVVYQKVDGSSYWKPRLRWAKRFF